MSRSPEKEDDRRLPPPLQPSPADTSQKEVALIKKPLCPPLLSLLQQPENSSPPPEERNGAIVATHAEERLPEERAEAMGGRRGKMMMRVESGVVRRVMLRRVEMGIRVLEAGLCLVAFSVMAADKTGGWAGDYFDRYPEYRYCFSVNVIAFAYSTFQVFSRIHYMIWKRPVSNHPLRYSFDFLLDQVLAYLLMSATSSAAARHDDWVTMFGSDRFTNMLIGSITTSFSAFLAFAISSIISAYKLFSLNP